jgi:NTP pyrophosphatase (non-canonical NTP hydrolase)
MKTRNMITALEEVSKFNAARYDREFNCELSVALLNEEYHEYFESEELHKRLDSVGDVLYVALGVLWKLDISMTDVGLAADEVADIMDLYSQANISALYLIKAHIESIKYDMSKPVLVDILTIVNLCMAQMFSLGLTEDEAFDVLFAIIKSNATKSVKKTASNIKANSGDKGPYYVSPDVDLQLIAAIVEQRLLAEYNS